MQMDSNIDRNDAVYNTNAPFEGGQLLTLGSLILSYKSFRSIRVYVTEGMVLPVRLASVVYSKDGTSKAYVRFEDANGMLVGRWEVVPTVANTTGDYISCFILNDSDTIMGHVVYDKNLPDALIAAAKSAGGTLRAKANSFRLLPQCHIPTFNGSAKAFKIGSQVYRSELNIDGSQNMEAFVDASGTADLRWKESTLPYKYKKNGICKLKVDNLVAVNGVQASVGEYDNTEFWVGGSHLIIRSTVTSNLRVVAENGSIVLKGVKE